jgi:hypothetical protein
VPCGYFLWHFLFPTRVETRLFTGTLLYAVQTFLHTTSRKAITRLVEGKGREIMAESFFSSKKSKVKNQKSKNSKTSALPLCLRASAVKNSKFKSKKSKISASPVLSGDSLNSQLIPLTRLFPGEPINHPKCFCYNKQSPLK